MKTMLPRPAFFIEAMTCFDARKAPRVFTLQASSKAAGVTSSIDPHTPEPALNTARPVFGSATADTSDAARLAHAAAGTTDW